MVSQELKKSNFAKIFICAFIFFILPSLSASENKVDDFGGILIEPKGNAYLCVVEAATGFLFESGNISTTNFQAGTKYIFKKVKTNKEKYDEWVYYQFGFKDLGATACIVDDGWSLNCQKNKFEIAQFNSDTKRFQIYHLGEYVVNDKFTEIDDLMRPKLEIGNCSKI